MRLNGCGALSLGIVGVVVIIAQGYKVHGSSLSLNPDQNMHLISKRNAWWSKKSTGTDSSLSPGYQMPLDGWSKESQEDMRPLTAAESPFSMQGKSLEDIKEAIGCYTERCVPDFVWCGRHTATNGRFLQCKLQHRICAAHCFNGPSLALDVQ